MGGWCAGGGMVGRGVVGHFCGRGRVGKVGLVFWVVYAFGWSCGGRPRGPMSGGAFMLYLFTVPSLLVFSFSSPIFMLYS